jgi:hypothetical protein
LAIPNNAAIRSPTSRRLRELVQKSPRGNFVNLFDPYPKLVYHQPIADPRP